MCLICTAPFTDFSRLGIPSYTYSRLLLSMPCNLSRLHCTVPRLLPLKSNAFSPLFVALRGFLPVRKLSMDLQSLGSATLFKSSPLVPLTPANRHQRYSGSPEGARLCLASALPRASPLSTLLSYLYRYRYCLRHAVTIGNASQHHLCQQLTLVLVISIT